MMKVILLAILVLITISLQAYDWPMRPFSRQHGINATLGEYRTGHLHTGVDIAPWDTSSTGPYWLVYSLESDTMKRYTYPPDTFNNGVYDKDSVFWYIHLTNRIAHNSFATAFVDSIGRIFRTEAHLHFTERIDGDLRLNPLRENALTPYEDSTRPHIDSVRFYRQGPGDTLLIGPLNGKVDVLAVAGDTRTDSTGHSADGNVSIYRVGYEVRDTSGNLKKSYWEKIRFDSIPRNAVLNLVYGSGSSESHFRYWVSNDPFNDTVAHRNWFWNTKQKINEPDTVDAESLEVAKFRDCYYWVIVKAYDIRDNFDAETVKVCVDNFAPKVRATDPVDGAINVPVHKKVTITFNERMDSTVNLRDAITFSPGVSGDWVWLDSIRCRFTPDPAFNTGTTYQVTVSTEMQDKSGRNMENPYIFQFTTSDTGGGGSPGMPVGYPTRYQWETVTSWDVSGSWFTNYYYFQYPSFAFPFYGDLYYLIIFNRRGSIWFTTNYDLAYFDLPTAGGTGEPVIAVYNDSLRHLFGHSSFGGSRELSNPAREVVRWRYTYYSDTTEFEAVLYETGVIRFDYRKCEINRFYMDAGSGISKGDGVNYFNLTANYGPVYDLAPASFIFTTEPPPGRVRELAAYHASPKVVLTWRPNPESDLKGYNVYRKEPGEEFYSRINPTLVTVTTYTDTNVQSGKTYIYAVTALDTFDLESPYSDSVVVTLAPVGINNYYATAFGKKLARSPDGRLHLVFADIDKVLYQYSRDDGETWSEPDTIGCGKFPTIVVGSDGNPAVIYGRWVSDPSDTLKGWQKLYLTRYSGLIWTEPKELFSTDRISRPVEILKVPKPFAGIDSGDTISVVFMAHYRDNLFASYFGRFYAGWPAFFYLDTLLTQEHPESPCHALAVDDSGVVHIVYERWGVGASKAYYRYYDGNLSSPEMVCSSAVYPYLDYGHTPNNLLLVWNEYIPDMKQSIRFRQKEIPHPWQDTMTVYGPYPWPPYSYPVISSWYCVWADSNIYFSRFNGSYWEPRDTIATSAEARFPQVLFYQDNQDTFLFVAYTEGKKPPYTIRFRRREVPGVPKIYADLGRKEKSPYCIRRKGYRSYGAEPFKNVDWDRFRLRYKFPLDPDKGYRMEVVYYFEAERFDAVDVGDRAEVLNMDLQRFVEREMKRDPEFKRAIMAPDGFRFIVPLLVVDCLPLNICLVRAGIAKRVVIDIPECLYQDGEIVVDIWRILGRLVTCGEIKIYEFEEKGHGRGGPATAESASSPAHHFGLGVRPNPVLRRMRVSYSLARDGDVRIRLYDVVGRLVKTLVAGFHRAGRYHKTVSGLKGGVYFVRMEAEGFTRTEKVVVLRD
ncbi:hypothetical protein DRP53_03395 [candidate division WOR-3 bacterium]|uniref:Fibronectin type-III domain-containing protein n=1 Tax=candidate division WOR-3 bacterium TaxID=2052148 RepID=A0A660SLC3_UNCW3|nr:MAG: hypothetical protein DRP53_03395 [candidate division WOR-3 bacterium]